MEISYTKADVGYECTAIRKIGKGLTVLINGAADGARVSLGGAFSKTASGKATFNTSGIENGVHTLYLHDGKRSYTVGTLEVLNGCVKVIENDDDTIYSLRRRLAETKAEIGTLKERISALETRVFRTVIF